MATDLNPSTDIRIVEDISLIRDKAIDILFSITATELRLTIFEHYLFDFLNNRTLNIRCPLFTILQERSQGSDPIVADKYKTLYGNALAVWEKIPDLTFHVTGKKAAEELNKMSRAERHTIKHIVFSPMLRLKSDKITLSNNLETIRVQLDKETEESMDMSGREIALSICRLLPASCKTLKKLTFESMHLSGLGTLHKAAKRIKGRIKIDYTSGRLPTLGCECDSEDRDYWLFDNQYVYWTWVGPFPVFTDAPLDLWQDSKSKYRQHHAVSRHRVLN